jgi:hypothetical protein
MLESKDDSPASVPFVRMPQKNKLVIHVAGGEFRKYLSLGFKPQHLYILSDEEIKEDEFDQLLKQGLYFESGNGIIKTITNQRIKTNGDYKKIIATTDKSLAMLVSDPIIGKAPTYFPEPSKSFIDVFVKEYNKGNIITEVMVEYEDYWIGVCHSLDVAYRPKVSKDNTITIKKVKDSWTKEEVKILFDRYNEFIAHHEPEEWNNFVSPTKNKYLRKGQALMNYLHEVWREEYLRLTNTSLDCFYRDDLIPKTIEHLQQIWK